MVIAQVITAEELNRLVEINAVCVLDAREIDDYTAGHIPGAIHFHPSHLEHVELLPSGVQVPHQLKSLDELGPLCRAAGVKADVPVCVYDEGGGYLAARVWWVLELLGHRRAKILDGGFFLWSAEINTVSTDAPPFIPGDFVPRPCPERRIGFSDAITSIGDPDVVVCNTLDAASYRIESIPGSLNYPYTQTYAEDNFPLLKSRHELASALTACGLRESQRIVVYCRIGYTACQVYFAARYAGFTHVAVYDGGMVDWSARGGELVPGV